MTLRHIFTGLGFTALSLVVAGCIEKVPDTNTAAITAPDVPAQTESTSAVAVSVTPPADTSMPLAEPEASHVSSVHDPHIAEASVDLLCEQIGNKLSSVSIEDCANQEFFFGGSFSVKPAAARYLGSLGNFAGLNRQIPVVTLELPSAGIMPPAEQIDLMWQDLVAWLDREGRKGLGHL